MIGFLLCCQGGHQIERQVKPTDSYSDRLLKYIPAEVSAAYLSINSLVPMSQSFSALMQLSLLVLAVLCVLYLRVLFSITNWVQLSASLVLFVIWSLNISAARLEDWHVEPLTLAIVLILATVAVPLIPVAPLAQPVPGPSPPPDANGN